MTIESELRILLHRYCAGLTAQVQGIGALLSDCGGNFVPAGSAAQAQAITHQMKGTAGTMGFPRLAAAAAALDDNLKALAPQAAGADRSAPLRTKELFASLAKIAGETSPADSALYGANLAHLTRQ